MFPRASQDKCASYCQYTPVFGDGTYIRCVFQLTVDRGYKVKYDHHDQLVQQANSKFPDRVSPPGGHPGGPSIFYESLWFHHIGFQDRPHAGRIAHALTFNDASGGNLFKVFLGRNEQGDIYPQQVSAYENLRETLAKVQRD